MKNYIGFVNDHSGSMGSIANAAIKDYNALIKSVKDAANTEMLDTVVSTVGFGLSRYSGKDSVVRQVQVSNPHVLKPITHWPCEGQTPMFDGIGSMIELLESLPDAKNEDVSFLVMTTTDGGENDSEKYSAITLAKKIRALQDSGRWTFVFRVPARGQTSMITALGVPAENIQKWETTSAGMEASTVQTQSAMGSYFAGRSAGKKSSNSFYSNAAAVDTKALVDISKEVSLYVVPKAKEGIEIRDFIMGHRMEYLKGAAFYQLTKTEAKVQPTKIILIRERKTGKVFAGQEARDMIGLPRGANARLHPGDHGAYDIFIQSTSVNRKLVGDTGVMYWAKIGTPFTAEDLAYLQPKAIKAPAAVKNAPVQLPAVAGKTAPTKSPISPKASGPRLDGVAIQTFETRSEARVYGSAVPGKKLSVKDLRTVEKHRLESIPSDHRWYVI